MSHIDGLISVRSLVHISRESVSLLLGIFLRFRPFLLWALTFLAAAFSPTILLRMSLFLTVLTLGRPFLLFGFPSRV